jgi:hypothetical protein
MAMRYRALGGTGIQVSAYCLGTMMFGSVGNPDRDDCARIIHAALDHGINFVDTADMYSAGESEEITGQALRGRATTSCPGAGPRPAPPPHCQPRRRGGDRLSGRYSSNRPPR